MKVYLASNFVLMRYMNLEFRFRKHLQDKYGYCARLFSFFFTAEIVKVVTIMKDEHNLELNEQEKEVLEEIKLARQNLKEIENAGN